LLHLDDTVDKEQHRLLFVFVWPHKYGIMKVREPAVAIKQACRQVMRTGVAE
jgi:hypothetical protein